MKRHLFQILIILFLGLIPAHLVMAQDLFTQEHKLVRLEESWSGEFSSSAAMDGNIIAVGAPSWKRTENCCGYGAVFIYGRDNGGPGNWGEVKKIAPTDITYPGGFGSSVAVSGDILVVGIKQTNGYYPSSSAVYIFYRNQGGVDNWGQVKKITGTVTDGIGYIVALEGDTLVIGDPDDAEKGSRAGAFHIFQRDAGGLNYWGKVKKIVPDDGKASDYFGGKVSLSGDTVAVGSSSSVYVFYRNHGGTNNWGQIKKISDVGTNYFSSSVALEGDMVIVGDPGDGDNGPSAGAAYIFQRDFGGIDNWGMMKKIVPGDGEADDRFGYRVSISGDAVAVGAIGDDDAGPDSGSAYVFYRNQGGTDNWGQITKILRDYEPLGGWAPSFGTTVFISGDTLVAGSPYIEEKGYSMGMAYLFERDLSGVDNWGLTKRLFPVDTWYVAGDRFGRSVSVDGDTIAVGAYLDDEDGSSSGAVYVFERNLLGTSRWGQYIKSYISAYTSNPGDYFGWSVSISSGTLIAGAYGDDDMGTDAGAAYISTRSNVGSDGWGYDGVRKLLASDGAASDYFGYAVAISEDTAVVGAYQDDDKGLSSGSVYIFQRDFGGPDNWGQVIKITPDDGTAYDYFGYSVSINGDTVAVGSYQDDDKGSGSGSVYIFYRNQGGPDNWGLVKKITPDDGAASDYFGKAVSLGTGGVLIVGATGDDDKGSASGSAYIFEQHYGGADNWGQINKLTAGDGAASDSFGCSVSAFWTIAVVGSCMDDDNGSNSGSAYIFMRRYSDGVNNWVQEQKLTAGDGLASDNFGEAVSISYDTIVIGASMDDDFGSLSGSAYVWVMDTDRDGIPDGDGSNPCTGGNSQYCDDNCINIPNPDQADADSNGIGDVCDFCTDTDQDGYCAEVDDCDDSNSSLNPETLWYQDNDGDGFGNYSLSLQQCTQPEGPPDYVLDKTDYDDFDPDIGAPVKIDRGTVYFYSSLQDAYNAAADGDIIQVIFATFNENLVADRNISVTLQGGYNGSYSAISGDTILQGNMDINDGIIVIENFQLRQ